MRGVDGASPSPSPCSKSIDIWSLDKGRVKIELTTTDSPLDLSQG